MYLDVEKNRDIRTITVYILNNFKRAYNKTYVDFFASTRKNLCAADFTINDIKLMKNSRVNASFEENFIKNSSIIINKVDIIKTNILISSTRTIFFKFSISKTGSATLNKLSQLYKIKWIVKSDWLAHYCLGFISSTLL